MDVARDQLVNVVHVAGAPNTYSFAAVLSGGKVLKWGDGEEGGDSEAVRDQLAADFGHVCASGSYFAALKIDSNCDGGCSVVTWGSADFGGNCDAVRAQLAAGV